jgi:hypothetical protein
MNLQQAGGGIIAAAISDHHVASIGGSLGHQRNVTAAAAPERSRPADLRPQPFGPRSRFAEAASSKDDPH